MAAFVCVLGEIRTALLKHSTGVSAEHARRLVSIVAGRSIHAVDRPISRAQSPTVLAGIDCDVTTTGGAMVRAIGTVSSRATIVGGHLVQASSHVALRRSELDRRLGWSHYTASPGVAELAGKASYDGVPKTFLASPQPDHVNLGAIGSRLMDLVQRRDGLDGQPAMRAERGSLRWAMVPTASATALTVGWGNGRTRTMRIGSTDIPLASVVDFIEDVARHDWLLTNALIVEERTRRASSQSEALDRVRAAVETLAAVWMPVTPSDPLMAPAWRAFDDHSGLSRQWQATIDRLRDRLLLSILGALTAGRNTP